jgi:1-acyl-sn-glycerol-3-phosphate acyltransferase
MLQVFYSEIKSIGVENVPPDGTPTIFVANHANGIVDAQIVFCHTPRTVRLLSKSTLLNLPVLGKCAKLIGTIPVFRRVDAAVGEGKPDHSRMFASAFDTLSQGASCAIFAEGTTHDDSQNRELMPGVALIALGATAERQLPKPIAIVPTGITYERKEKSRSRALIHFGKPVYVTQEMAQQFVEHKHLGRDNPITAALLQSVDAALRQVTVNVSAANGGWPVVSTLKQVARLFSMGITMNSAEMQELSIQLASLHEEQFTRRDEGGGDIERWAGMLEAVDHYLSHLEFARLSDHEVRVGRINALFGGLGALSLSAIVIALFPVVLLGRLINFPVIAIARFGANKMATSYMIEDVKRGMQKPGYKALDVVASHKMFIGMFVIPLLYLAYGIAFGEIIGRYFDMLSKLEWGVVCVAALPLISTVYVYVRSGMAYAFRGLRTMTRLSIRQWLCCCLSRDDSLHQLQAERQALASQVRAVVYQVSPKELIRSRVFEAVAQQVEELAVQGGTLSDSVRAVTKKGN